MSTTEDDALPRPAPRFVPTLTEVVGAADASAPAAAPSVPAPSTPVAPPPMPSIGAATAAHTAHAMLAMVSHSDGIKRLAISSETGRRETIEVPKSPCNTLVM